MNVYLVRHAIAEQRDATRWPDDSRRRLTPEGAERFRSAARGLQRIAPEVEAVLSSGYARAWESAEILAEAAKWPSPEESAALEASRSPEAALEVLQVRGESSLALVGHEPHLSRLASLLLAGSADAVRLELKKGAVASLGLPERPTAGTALLRWSVSPRILRRLGR